MRTFILLTSVAMLAGCQHAQKCTQSIHSMSPLTSCKVRDAGNCREQTTRQRPCDLSNACREVQSKCRNICQTPLNFSCKKPTIGWKEVRVPVLKLSDRLANCVSDRRCNNRPSCEPGTACRQPARSRTGRTLHNSDKWLLPGIAHTSHSGHTVPDTTTSTSSGSSRASATVLAIARSRTADHSTNRGFNDNKSDTENASSRSRGQPDSLDTATAAGNQSADIWLHQSSTCPAKRGNRVAASSLENNGWRAADSEFGHRANLEPADPQLALTKRQARLNVAA